ncbi:methyl-accepting chemotaxis protein [Paenibacillus hamazuiensis]|uniref:methyl-accepting chemotaxis protein n=1 Tax=Paenibacillus hamazuiensis TaxID=2936508 RepID=UPI00200F02AE|nr:methyl-accepting chemotaxis protein [Paenibacillus hamazuiensis]
MKNWPLRIKLMIGFLAVMVLFVSAEAVSIVYLRDIKASIALQNQRTADENTAEALKSDIGELYSNQADVIINESEKAAAEFRENSQAFKQHLQDLQASVDTPEEKEWFKGLSDKGDKYLKNFDAVMAVYQKRSSYTAKQLSDEYKRIDNETDTYKQAMFDAIDKLIGSYEKERKAAADNLEREMADTIAFTIAICAGAAVFGGLIFFGFGTYLVRSVREVVLFAERVAQGDLTGQLRPRSGDEVGRLTESINSMVDKLKHLIRRVNEQANMVAASSEQMDASAAQSVQMIRQISGSIEQVAAGAQAQERSAEEASRAMEEMAVGVQRVAERSGVVSELSLDASEKAKHGNASIRQVVSQMETIDSAINQVSDTVNLLGEQTREIVQIIDMISGISTQTNLLALNASIEAARAGEHGRGFAVVAGEVRKLAEQTGESAQRIAGIVEAIGAQAEEAVRAMASGQAEVRVGIDAVRDTGGRFEEIMASVLEVSDQITDMSSVAEQMSAGAQQVAASVIELSDISRRTSGITQEVAAASEEQLATLEDMASASRHLSGMATGLQEAVGKFKV